MNYRSPRVLNIDAKHTIQFEDWRTLPLRYCRGRVTETIPALGKGKAVPTYQDHNYPLPEYEYSSELLQRVSVDHKFAELTLRAWLWHESLFGYFIQFETDLDGSRAIRFSDHTKLAAAIIDDRTTLDSAPLWEERNSLLEFRWVHMDYRDDVNREENYVQHEKALEVSVSKLDEITMTARTLIDRSVQQIDLKSGKWSSMEPINNPIQKNHSQPLSVFISYSHADEVFMDTLITHLSAMKRQGLVKNWYDRCITGGKEWEGQIDDHLESSSVILLLISADFISSDYCYDVELSCAMKKHSEGTATVIPVFLRPCDWKELPFGKLQGLPKDARPVTKWGNRDEAFTVIAKGVRKVITGLLVSNQK